VDLRFVHQRVEFGELVNLVAFELCVRKLDLELALISVWDLLVGYKVYFSLDFAHSLNNTGVWLHNIAQGLSCADLERNIPGRRSVLDLQMADVLTSDESNNLCWVQSHKLAYICS